MSVKMKKALTDVHNEARQRVVQRGTVHFRLTPESMSNLLKAADRYKKPYGTMCREWVEYHLDLEMQEEGTEANIFVSNGKTDVCALHPKSKTARTIETPFDTTMAADCGCIFRRGLKATGWVRLVVGEGLHKPYATAG